MKDEAPIPGGQRAAHSESKGLKKKVRRVSQRRELAVVTLGAVATITGLGGLLAANPPSWTAPLQAAPAESALVDQAEPSAQAPVEQAQPVYSAPSPTPAATQSRGS